MSDNDKVIKHELYEFEKICIDIATNFDEKYTYENYKKKREQLLNITKLYGKLPSFIIENKFGSQFRSYMQKLYSSYAKRRELIYEGFGKLEIDLLNETKAIAFDLSKEVVVAVENQKINDLWLKLRQRYNDDFDGAVTASRTLVETTIYYILKQLGLTYDENLSLPKLYNLVAKELSLSPDSKTHLSIQKILTGLITSIQGFSEYRNLVSDAHGSPNLKEIKKYHIELILNLSGMFTQFLLSVYKEKTK
jgi:hypothetical protein